MSKCSFGHGLKSHYLADKEHEDSAEFRKFRRNLFHRYGGGYYRRKIYGIGPYIADYPEQVLLACVVQGWCPR
jgi:hypothetical protein